jgi:hypothetical protein
MSSTGFFYTNNLHYFLSWIDYWLKKNARDEYKSALSQMLFNLFYDKISSTLQDTAARTEDKEPVKSLTTPSGADFLIMQMVMRKRVEVDEVASDRKEVADRVDQILKQEVDKYVKYILEVDYIDLIAQYPSKMYNAETLDTDRVITFKDPLYTASMFDVFNWWRTYGRKHFKLIEICALIVFGKPIHNGFQERVFSRGTFTDDQLRRRMKEETFEIAILESINCDVVDRYMKHYKTKNLVDPTKLASSAETFMRYIKNMNDNIPKSDENSTETEDDDDEYDVETEDFLDQESDHEYISET